MHSKLQIIAWYTIFLKKILKNCVMKLGNFNCSSILKLPLNSDIKELVNIMTFHARFVYRQPAVLHQWKN